ncbi:MAG: hypothetical protein GX900_07950, partial [Clostridiaceae bacterium]|nr:hypothetical protein [Clostridiaceae bacterium]
MKKYRSTALLLIVALLLTTIVTGCSAEKSLFGFYGDIVKAWQKNYNRTSPGELTIYVERGGIDEPARTIT